MAVEATGGIVSTVGGFKIHKFTADGVFTVTQGGNVEVLVVAGGGAGGTWCGGGGGAGGVLYEAAHAVTPQSYTLQVGVGAPHPTTNSDGADGENSIFDTLTAIGGGGGGSSAGTEQGRNGGSGGGAAHQNTVPGTGVAGPPRQGYDGGPSDISYNSGGGGGAGEAGNTDGLGYGGDGTSAYSDLLIAAEAGVDIGGIHYIAGGGGGWVDNPTRKPGGDGGGGGGGTSQAQGNIDGGDGLPNTGGGGGGGHYANYSLYGGAGGSGIIIVRYAVTAPISETITDSLVTGDTPDCKMSAQGSVSENISLGETADYTVTSPPAGGVLDDSYTKLLMHFNGVDGATTYFDEGQAGSNWVEYESGFELDSDQSKYGTTSLKIPYTTGGYLEYAGEMGSYNPGSGNFTIDFWARFGSVVGDLQVIDIWGGMSEEIIVGIRPSGAGHVVYLTLKTNARNLYPTLCSGAPFTLNAGEWTHFEICRNGNAYSLFVNGVLLDTISLAALTFAMSGEGYIDLCCFGSGTDYVWVDELRYSVGIARHTETFTPMTRQYGPMIDDEYSKILCHFDGTDAAKEIKDELGKTFTNSNGLSELDSTYKKFGDTSLLVKSNNIFEYLGALDSLNPGSGNFTVDFWVRFNALFQSSGQFMPIEIYSNTTYDRINVAFWSWGSGVYAIELHVVANNGGNGYYIDLGDGSPFTIPTDTWQHYEICRNGNDYLLFINGILTDTKTIDPHSINLTGDGYAQMFFLQNGQGDVWVDEFRYSVGVARHTASFTPPTMAYGDSVPPPPPPPPEDYTYDKIRLHFNQIVPYNSSDTFFNDGMGADYWMDSAGSVTMDTLVKKFGAGAFISSGAPDRNGLMKGGAHYNYNPLSNFTIDFWLRCENDIVFSPSVFGYIRVLDLRSNDFGCDDYLTIRFYGTTFEIELRANHVDCFVWFGQYTPLTLVKGEWVHYEIGRDGNSYFLFINGSLIEQITVATHTFALIGGQPQQLFSTYQMEGTFYVDEYRYSNGITRHTTSFTPPTREYGALFDLYEEAIGDGLSLGDDYEVIVVGGIQIYDNTVGDYLTLDSVASFYRNPRTVQDNILFYDTTKEGWGLTVVLNLGLEDNHAISLAIPLDEWLAITDSELTNWNGREILLEGMTIYDLAGLGQIIQDTTNEQLDLNSNVSYKLTIKILEALGFNDLAAAILNLAMTGSSSLQMNDAPRYGFNDFVIELLSVIDAQTVIGKFLEQNVEVIDFLGDNFWQRGSIVSAEDMLEFVDYTSNLGQFYSVVYDMLAMEVIVELAGDVWQCYVLNTPHFHPSMYSGFDFNSYCVFENRAYGANNAGIYELTGDTDAGEKIHTGAIMSKTDFGMANQKRFRRGYLGISGESPVMVFEAENGEREAFAIDSEGKTVGSYELKSKKWVLSVADFDTLDTVKLVPIILTR